MKHPLMVVWAMLAATSANAGEVLWNDLEFGMTRQQFRALYPKMKTELSEGCRAVVTPLYGDGRLIGVWLENHWNDSAPAGCGNIVLKSLLTKYGAPVQTEAEVQTNSCGNPYASGLGGKLAKLCEATGGDKPYVHENAYWVNNGVKIHFHFEPQVSAQSWSLTYTKAPVIPTIDDNKL